MRISEHIIFEEALKMNSASSVSSPKPKGYKRAPPMPPTPPPKNIKNMKIQFLIGFHCFGSFNLLLASGSIKIESGMVNLLGFF